MDTLDCSNNSGRARFCFPAWLWSLTTVLLGLALPLSLLCLKASMYCHGMFPHHIDHQTCLGTCFTRPQLVIDLYSCSLMNFSLNNQSCVRNKHAEHYWLLGTHNVYDSMDAVLDDASHTSLGSLWKYLRYRQPVLPTKVIQRTYLIALKDQSSTLEARL